MSFISNLKSLFSGGDAQKKSFSQAVFSFFNPQASSFMGKNYVAAHKGWVYACTNAIARRVADIDLKL